MLCERCRLDCGNRGQSGEAGRSRLCHSSVIFPSSYELDKPRWVRVETCGRDCVTVRLSHAHRLIRSGRLPDLHPSPSPCLSETSFSDKFSSKYTSISSGDQFVGWDLVKDKVQQLFRNHHSLEAPAGRRG